MRWEDFWGRESKIKVEKTMDILYNRYADFEYNRRRNASPPEK